MKKHHLIAAAAIALFAGPASADIVEIDFYGTIIGGTDNAGAFGMPGASFTGDAVSVAFIVDMSKGVRDSGPSYFDYLRGVGLTSPVLYASATIAGKSFKFGKDADADFRADKGDYLVAEVDQHLNGPITFAEIGGFAFTLDPTTGQPVPMITSLAANYTSPSNCGCGSDALTFLAPGPVETSLAYKVDSFSIRVLPALPEPATWLMMLFGMAACAAALRCHRRMATTD